MWLKSPVWTFQQKTAQLPTTLGWAGMFEKTNVANKSGMDFPAHIFVHAR